MSPYSLPALLAFAINVSLVIIVLLDNLKSRTHRLFALLISCFALWNVADIVVINSTTPEAASLGGAIIVGAVLFVTAFFLVLSFSFPVSIGSRFDRLPIRSLFLILPLLFTILSGLEVFQPLDLHRFAELSVYSYVVNDSMDVLNVAMFATVFVYLAWGVGNLIQQLKLAQSRKVRLQVLHVLFGAIGFGFLIVLLDVLHENQQVHFYSSRGLFLLISFFFAYVVLGNRLLVLRRLGKQGLAYALVTGLVFGFYLIIIKNIAEVLSRKFDISSLFFEALLILALAVVFRPLVVRIQSLVENLFYQSMFSRRQKFIHFSREVFHLTDLPGLTKTVVAFLKETLSASRAEIMVEDANAGVFRSVLTPQRVMSPSGDLLQLLRREQKVYEVAELLSEGLLEEESCSEEQRGVLRDFNHGYIVPLPLDNGMLSMLLIGPTVSGKNYTMDEEEFLAVFANEVSAAIERNVLMEKVRAQELRAAHMEKLAALGRLTAGIAHEFRNPLNIISTSAQTILRNPDNLPLLSETGKYIIEETDRLSRTVDEFLQFAKPHTPTWSRGSIDDVIDNVIQALRAHATDKHIRLQKATEGHIPPITTSHRHVERALINVGMNAIEAMSEGGELMILLEPKDTSAITISVRDTGPGIPTEYHARLFDPFFTTKPSGTGLGLVIAYMMVQAVRGKISFNTSSNGTTFCIELPTDEPQQ